MTKVYTASVDPLKDPVMYQQALELLPASRRESANRMKVESGKRLSAGAGLLLLAALADYMQPPEENQDAQEKIRPDGPDPVTEQDTQEKIRPDGPDPKAGQDRIIEGIRQLHDLRIAQGEQGKPWLPDHPEVHFNLSHSGSRVMCIVAPQPVGCDIEVIDPRHIHQVIRCLAKEEQAAASSSAADFFRIWTLKESILKLSGQGLQIPLRSFVVTLDPLSVRQGFLPGTVYLKEYDTFREDGTGCCCACATCGRELPEEMTQVELADFLFPRP